VANALWEPDFDRLLTVLKLQGEPDRLPFLDFMHDPLIMQQALGREMPGDAEGRRQFRVDFAAECGYDVVRGTVANYHFRGPEHRRAEDTAEVSRGERSWRDDHAGLIASWEDFEVYPWPRIEEADFSDIEALSGMLPANMKIVVALPSGVLENLIRVTGYEPLCFMLQDDPELVRAIADRVGECELALYEALVDFEEIGALWLNDDLGFKTATMVSPDSLREYVFPWHTKLVECAHRHDTPVILHACGNVSEVMEDLIATGIDAKHSFEDIIMPVAQFEREYGDRLAAIGGIDMDVISRCSEDEVREYTRGVIEECAPGGGWALGTGNSVPNYVPVQNFLAMLDEGRRFGAY
jgi:uroporphyrinogen decarboxylase